MTSPRPTALPVLDSAAPPPLRPRPTKLFVELTTRCNLHCAACVKQAPGQALVEGDMTDETFERLAPAFPGLEALVLNGVGESLLHPRLVQYVERARRDVPASAWIGFQTNGQLLDRERALALVRAGVDKVCVSADAVSPEVFRVLRGGGKQEAVETAVTALQAAARATRRPLSLGVEFVAMRRNVRQLPELVRWAARNQVGFVIVTHMLPYHERMSDAVAFDSNTDRALQIYRTWKARAEADGIDLGRYFDVFMKFRRTREEQRIVDYVELMVSDATAQGVTLHVKKLLAADEALLEQVAASFAEAEELARREGVDLRLPAANPSRVRHCDFVEDGSAFVSWDGGLHPCYFLWHRYRAHVAGVVKRVRPHTFGNAGAEDVLALWNGEPWRAFRAGVLRYDFPFCYDCNVALCDYTQDEEFTQDCHVGTVPCASCLWCTGVFQCLR